MSRSGSFRRIVVIRRVAVSLMLMITATSCSLEIAGPEDPMLIVDGDGDVISVNASGDERMLLSEDDDVPFQPIWAPDGDLAAFANIGDEPGLVVVARNGETRWEGPTESAPFFFSWAIGSSSLALLRNGEETISLDMVRLLRDDAGLIVTPRDAGAPYYFDWGLNADRIVAHVGADRLDLVEALLSGDITPLDVPPGSFQAPEWTERGVFTVEAGSSLDQVVLIDVSSDVQPLAQVSSPAWLDASPDGDRLAIQSFAGGVDAISAAYQDIPTITTGLAVLDIESGDLTTVSGTPTFAFFWSPAGDKLLMLVPGDEDGDARWQVWEDGELSDGPSFTPDQSWVASFLPFFDQYARSMSLWSPDDGAFAFPGEIDGESGIWVHDLESGETNRVSSGSWVAWSTP